MGITDIDKPLEDSRWSDTLDALESIKSGKFIAEADVNAWLNSRATGERKELPKPLSACRK